MLETAASAKSIRAANASAPLCNGAIPVSPLCAASSSISDSAKGPLVAFGNTVVSIRSSISGMVKVNRAIKMALPITATIKKSTFKIILKFSVLYWRDTVH